MNQEKLVTFQEDLRIISSASNRQLLVERSPYDSDAMALINALRTKEYQGRGASYLCDPRQDVLKKNVALDMRSAHLTVWNGPALMGALRLTAAPFELAEETGVSWVNQEYSNHMEFGRLVMASAAGYRAPAEKLMAAGCLHALEAGKAGVVAMSRPVQARLFERYGLKPIVPFPSILPQRDNGTYWLLAASWSSMFEPIARIAAAILRRRDNLIAS